MVQRAFGVSFVIAYYKQDEPILTNGKSPNNFAVLDENGNMLFKSKRQN
jgi:hypothetical protein